MKDALGNTIKVGDMVAYVRGAKNCPEIGIGFVDKIYKNDKECTVSGTPHIYGFRILKWTK